MKLRDILGILRDSYCRTIGIEYMHIQDPEQRRWIQERVERRAQQAARREEQLHILTSSTRPRRSRRSCRPSTSARSASASRAARRSIPLLDASCEAARRRGLDEVVIGMAHRGRLNVLANIVGKSYGQIFREFEGNIDPQHRAGLRRREVPPRRRRARTPRPTVQRSTSRSPPTRRHLEAVDPVLEGIVRAKQDVLNKGAGVPGAAAARSTATRRSPARASSPRR